MEQEFANKIEQFFGQGKPLSYRKGQIIVPADQDPAGVMWLLSGVVEQYWLSRDGTKASVNLFKPQAFFPMSWAINKTPNQYFFAALTDVELRLMPANQTVAFVKSNPDVLYDLLTRVYRGTDGLLQRLSLVGVKETQDRVMFELVTECYRFGQQIDHDTWQIAVTQTSLARRSGLARETVSRELHKMAQRQLVKLGKGVILVNLALVERSLRS